MNERVSHHRVVSGVPMDAQTPVYRPHTSVQTLKCVLNRMHQTVRGGARTVPQGSKQAFRVAPNQPGRPTPDELAAATSVINQMKDADSKGLMPPFFAAKSNAPSLNVVACAMALRSGEAFSSPAQAKASFVGVGKSTDLRAWFEKLARLESFAPAATAPSADDAPGPRLSSLRLMVSTARAHTSSIHELQHHPVAGALAVIPRNEKTTSNRDDLRAEFEAGMQASFGHYEEELREAKEQLRKAQEQVRAANEQASKGLGRHEGYQLGWVAGKAEGLAVGKVEAERMQATLGQLLRECPAGGDPDAWAEIVPMLQRSLLQAHSLIGDLTNVRRVEVAAGAMPPDVMQCVRDAEDAADCFYDVAMETANELRARLDDPVRSFRQ